MKKSLLILILILLLTGCSFSERRLYEEKANRYATSWQSILDNDKFASSSAAFDIRAEMVKEGDAYTYQVVLDNAQHSLYNVEIVVIENNASYSEEKMMASAGVFDGPYILIPNQNRTDKGYMGGIALNGQSAVDTLNLKIMVTWSDYSLVNSKKEYLEFDLTPLVEEAEAEETPADTDE